MYMSRVSIGQAIRATSITAHDRTGSKRRRGVHLFVA